MEPESCTRQVACAFMTTANFNGVMGKSLCK